MATTKYKRSCFACRIMRSMAFSGIGAALGGFVVLAFGGSQENALLTAVVMAAIFVFAFTDRKKK